MEIDKRSNLEHYVEQASTTRGFFLLNLCLDPRVPGSELRDVLGNMWRVHKFFVRVLRSSRVNLIM